jgi:hypothetical protein
MCRGPGHIVVYGNPAFVATYGAGGVGMPVREILLDFPTGAFYLFDAVLQRGKPLALWIRLGEEDWRLTVTPRIDPAGEVYGVAFHLRARSDVPVISTELPDYGPGRRFA